MTYASPKKAQTPRWFVFPSILGRRKDEYSDRWHLYADTCTDEYTASSDRYVLTWGSTKEGFNLKHVKLHAESHKTRRLFSVQLSEDDHKYAIPEALVIAQSAWQPTGSDYLKSCHHQLTICV